MKTNEAFYIENCKRFLSNVNNWENVMKVYGHVLNILTFYGLNHLETLIELAKQRRNYEKEHASCNNYSGYYVFMLLNRLKAKGSDIETLINEDTFYNINDTLTKCYTVLCYDKSNHAIINEIELLETILEHLNLYAKEVLTIERKG